MPALRQPGRLADRGRGPSAAMRARSPLSEQFDKGIDKGCEEARRGAATSLWLGRREALDAQVWETAVWVALAGGSLAVLVMSLWL